MSRFLRQRGGIPQGIIGRSAAGRGDPKVLSVADLRRMGLAPAAAAAAAATQSLKAGTGITITDNGDGTVTISSSGGGGSGHREGSVTIPHVADFTQVNFGGSTTAVDGNTGVILSDPTSTGNMHALVKAVPGSTPYDVYARIADLQPFASEAGIILRNSTSGRLIFMGMWQNDLVVSRWTSLTAFNANLINSAAHKGAPSWWRIHNDGTNLTFLFSHSGLDWLQFNLTEALATFVNAAGGTVDQQGFVVSTDGNGKNALICDSFSNTAPT